MARPTSAQTRRTRQKDWRPAFLARLAQDGDVSKAAEAAGVGRATVYEHRDQEPELCAQWDEAIEIALDRLEAEVVRRGLEGWLEPVYYMGEAVGTVRKYSDTLLLAKLNARAKGRGYGRQDMRVEVQVEDARKEAHRRIETSKLSDEDKAAAHAEVDRALDQAP